MKEANVVLVVSTDPSDLYFGNILARRLNAVGIVVEDQSSPEPGARRAARWGGRLLRPWLLPTLLKQRRIVARHVEISSSIDRAAFGDDGYRLRVNDSCRVVQISGKGAVNAPETVAAVRSLDPDLLVLCGCSILKEEMLSLPRLGTLNLHGGLAQRYRGVWTTLWAVVNREPEYIGATVHFVSPGIDDGDIVYQGRPEIEAQDNPETLYVKVVKLGIAMMASAVQGVVSGTVARLPLRERGRLYLERMVTPQVLAEAWEAIDEGVVPQYLADRARRDAAVTAMMLGPFEPGE